MEARDDMKVAVRHLTIADYKDLKESMIQAYTGSRMSYWHEENIENLLTIFPEGQLCVVVNERVVAAALSLIIEYS